MKKYLILLCGLWAAVSLSSCNDFLEKPPGVDVTEDTIFSNVNQVETFVAGTYQIAIPIAYPMNSATERGLNGSIHAAACDEGEAVPTWSNAHSWNNGVIGPNTIHWDEDPRYHLRWRAVRNCNILLERIGLVSGAPQSYKDQVRGEALFLRALQYFEAVKRYGGVPVIDRRLGSADEILLPRNTLKECMDFIVADCDEAAGLLPPFQPSHMRGRATRGAALALKSRALLYAASPLFNTAAPYLDLGDSNQLICYGNHDQTRWQKAADAAKAVLDWAASAGCSLVNQYGPDQNYEMVWTLPDNPEIILANKQFDAWTRWTRAFQVLLPGWAGGWGDGGVTVPLNFVKLYEKKDGTKQHWDMNGGDDLLQKYAELDPRFNQTITAHGAEWNAELGKVSLYGPPHTTFCKGGHWMRKLIPRNLLLNTGSVNANWIVLRLGEVYLNYAEALNEAGGPVEEAYQAIDIIRERSGMPKLPRGLSQEAFRERVRNERAVELAFEEHRLWDIRRWMIAGQEGVMKGTFYGITVTPAGEGGEARYQPVVFENRVWHDKMYLHPFLAGEVFKGYLVQNPGW